MNRSTVLYKINRCPNLYESFDRHASHISITAFKHLNLQYTHTRVYIASSNFIQSPLSIFQFIIQKLISSTRRPTIYTHLISSLRLLSSLQSVQHFNLESAQSTTVAHKVYFKRFSSSVRQSTGYVHAELRFHVSKPRDIVHLVTTGTHQVQRSGHLRGQWDRQRQSRLSLRFLDVWTGHPSSSRLSQLQSKLPGLLQQSKPKLHKSSTYGSLSATVQHGEPESDSFASSRRLERGTSDNRWEQSDDQQQQAGDWCHG